MIWATKFMNLPETKAKLGARPDIEFTFGGDEVYRRFRQEGDEYASPLFSARFGTKFSCWRCQQAYLLYEPLLQAGYRLLREFLRLRPFQDSSNSSVFLDYIGKLDANCAWPGVLSTLRLIRSQYQEAFVAEPDVPWDGEDATLRVIGEGAGNMTYVLIGKAGHFVSGLRSVDQNGEPNDPVQVTRDQPELVKKIVGRWIDNVPFQ